MNPENISQSDVISLIKMAVQKHHLGQWHEAESIYRQILKTENKNLNISREYLGDLYNLVVLNFGDTLQKIGKLKEAIQIYQQALTVEPNFAEVHNNLGNIFEKRGQLEAAVECYQQALRIKPNLFYAYNNLGNVLKGQNKLEAAIAAFQQALKIEPNWADAHYNLGTTLNEQGKLEAAVAAFQEALKIQPDYAGARFGVCMSQLPIIYSSFDEIQLKRNQYQQHLQDLADYYQAANSKERASGAGAIGSLQPFYLAYQGFNDRPLQQIYGQMICQLMSSCYPQSCQPIPLPNLEVNDKVRIGFVSAYFRDHSNWKIPIKGWVENLNRSEFELFGYYLDTKRDEETIKAAKAFDKFTQGSLLFEQWCELIQKDKLHILIFPEFGMDPMTVRLGCLRLAPIQMTSWGHPETSGLPTIDYYLSSDLMEPENAQEHYTEQLVSLPNIGIHYTPLEIESHVISKKGIGIADDGIMFWCCQSLFKYLPQHDDVFPRIVKELARCKFVFIKHHASEQITEVFRQRLSRTFAELALNYQDYCIFLPHMNTRNFAGTTAIADVFLDSIGWSGCNSTLEAIAHNIPVMTYPGELMRGRHTMAILKMMGIEETIAASKDDYVRIAVRLGQDPQYRQYISQQIAENKHKLYADLKPVSALEDFLLKLVNKPRRFAAAEAAQILQLAVQHQRANRLTDAEQLYRQVLAKQPEHPEALYGLGMLAQQMGQPQMAEQWLSAASQVQPNSVKIWFSLANLRQAQGQLSAAEEAYQRAIALRPDAAPIYNNLGYSLQQQGKWSEAIASYQKALEVQPNCTEAEVNLGNALHAQGKLSKEEQTHYAALNLRLGFTRQKAGDGKNAVTYYEQAIALQADLWQAHYNLGIVLQEQGEIEKAQAFHQKALELKPDLVEAH